MQRCTYRVLEFAKSDLEVDGLTFAILVRFDNLQKGFFKSFYLDEWPAIVGNGFESEISYVNDVLFDLRQYSRRNFGDSEAVMKETEELSAGVLRTRLSGTASLPPLEQIHHQLSEDKDNQTCSAAAFSALLTALYVNPASPV